MKKPSYWVYMLLCENNAYYTGYTNNLAARYQSHCDGSSLCKFTRSFKPIKMVQCWKVNGEKAIAMRLERYIKKQTRARKEELVNDPTVLCDQDPSIEIITSKQRQRILAK